MSEPTTPSNPGTSGQPDKNPPATPPAGDNNGHGTGEDKRSFTQSELDALFAQRADRAEKKAVADLLAGLGVKDAEELKVSLDAAKKAREAQMSELDKAKQEAADIKAKLEKAETERKSALERVTQTLLRQSLLAEAAKAGVDETELASVWMAFQAETALKGKVKAKEDETFEGVADAVKEIVKAHPRWLKSGSGSAHGTPRPGAKPPAGQGQGAGGEPPRKPLTSF